MVVAMRELRAAMDARTPHGSLQLSFDAPWSPWGLPQANVSGAAPACVDGRCFDFKGIASTFGENDFFFVMDYAMQSQIYARPGSNGSRCAAGADCPLAKVQLGMRQFLEAGVPADQLVLGAPWSSMYYPCLATSASGECDITHRPFSNAPCSDLSADLHWSVNYNEALSLHLAHPDAAVRFDAATATAIFDVPWNWTEPGRGSGTRVRVFWETPEALTLKYKWAGEAGLRGVGLWTSGYAPQGHDAGNRTVRAAFWASLASFRVGEARHV